MTFHNDKIKQADSIVKKIELLLSRKHSSDVVKTEDDIFISGPELSFRHKFWFKWSGDKAVFTPEVIIPCKRLKHGSHLDNMEDPFVIDDSIIHHLLEKFKPFDEPGLTMSFEYKLIEQVQRFDDRNLYHFHSKFDLLSSTGVVVASEDVDHYLVSTKLLPKSEMNIIQRLDEIISNQTYTKRNTFTLESDRCVIQNLYGDESVAEEIILPVQRLMAGNELDSVSPRLKGDNGDIILIANGLREFFIDGDCIGIEYKIVETSKWPIKGKLHKAGDPEIDMYYLDFYFYLRSHGHIVVKVKKEIEFEDADFVNPELEAAS